MELKFTFKMEACIEGDTIEEIRQQYDELICSQSQDGAEFVETVSIEDTDTSKNMWDAYYHSGR